MTGPAWLAAGFAGLMLLIAIASAGRLAVGRIRHRGADVEADALHILMGVAMAGMIEPRLSPVPAAAWRAIFALAAAWFVWQAVGSRIRRKPARPRCAYAGPHAVECAAMVYMLLPARPAHGAAMAMAGMSGAATAGNPALALVLAMFMLGYILWNTDQLATLSRVRAAIAPAPSSAAIAPRGSAARSAVAPRLAVCARIAMSLAMGYMLVTLL